MMNSSLAEGSMPPLVTTDEAEIAPHAEPVY
jgi:hypothetical protein